MTTTTLTRFRLHPQASLTGYGAVTPALLSPEVTVIRRDPLAVAACMASGQSFVVAGPDTPVTEMDDDAGYLHTLTSGSTGRPKRIRRTQASWVASFETNASAWGITPADRYAVIGALDHSLSLYALCEGLHLGATVDVLSGMRPDRQITAMQGVTILYATPAQLRGYNAACPSVRIVAVGGGAMDAATTAQTQANFPNARIYVFYGSAETSFATMSDESTPAGSVGKAYGSSQLRIDDQGIVWTSGPYLSDGYSEGSSTATRRDGKWMTVSEIGRLDSEGNLYIIGRADRMFTVADRNYHPELAEAALLAINGVTHAAVLPARDDKRGRVPVGIYTGTADPEDIAAEARKALAELAPRKFLRISDWPLLPSGKTDLTLLAHIVGPK